MRQKNHLVAVVYMKAQHVNDFLILGEVARSSYPTGKEENQINKQQKDTINKVEEHKRCDRDLKRKKMVKIEEN